MIEQAKFTYSLLINALGNKQTKTKNNKKKNKTQNKTKKTTDD